MMPDSGKIIQMAWVVPDLDIAMKNWLKIGKAGPFHVVRHTLGKLEARSFYRKQPVDIDISVGLAQCGDVMLELIEQHNDVASPYRESVPRRALGFHHVAMWAEDWEKAYADMERQGAVVAMEGDFAGARFAYYDTVHTLGCMLELNERTEAQLALYRTVREAAQNWQGEDPVRSLLASSPKLASQA